MQEEKIKKLEFSRKNLVAILITTTVVGGLVINIAGQATMQVLKNGGFGGNNAAVAMPNLFNNQKQSTETIKVVSEESQVIDVVAKSSPAVVSIVATAEVPTFETTYSQDDFFGFMMPQTRQNGTEERKVGAGTGFIVSADGYIVTNKHVVADEKAKYTVFLNDKDHKGEKLEAKVLARDPNNDLAVLKIEKKDLPFLEFDNSEQLKVGQTAITIGYALGEFENTVSKGVVSGLSRSITAGGNGMAPENLKNLIQSDAAINPGNSGGPMLNIAGKVIGVNVAMASGENIGFAIPGNMAKSVYEEVKKTGVIKKDESAFLGVRYVPINTAIKAKNKLNYDYGALVLRGTAQEDLAVLPGSPADKAGIVENDIILELNKEKITDKAPLTDLVAKHKPGDEITLKISHRGQEKEIKVKLGKN